MISGERQKVMQKAARWPCGVCDRDVGNNSIVYFVVYPLLTTSTVLVVRSGYTLHKKCSGIKGNML